MVVNDTLPSVKADHHWLKEVGCLLSAGTVHPRLGRIEPFGFWTLGGQRLLSRSAGLEGFLFSKLEYEHSFGEDAFLHQLGDHFQYLIALMEPIGWTSSIRARLAALRDSAASPMQKSQQLNAMLAETVISLQTRVDQSPASWGRQSHTYIVLPRAWRPEEGRCFFDQLDDAALARIREETGADQIWVLDAYELGEVNRWGTGGGSPFAIHGYRIRASLGGAEAWLRFVQRARKHGLRTRLCLIPNHTSPDSELLSSAPHAFLHVVPPQHLSDDEINSALPREPGPNAAPVFHLARTYSYPGREGLLTRILIHHPRTDYGDVMWIDMGQLDFSQPVARQWVIAQTLRLFDEYGVDSVRVDMAYYILNIGFFERWLTILRNELRASRGWMQVAMRELIHELQARWARLGGAEFLEELHDAVKRAHPHANLDHEAYNYFTELSRAGADGIYGKNTHDAQLGQVGLYDALRRRSPEQIQLALRNIAYRSWQRGGASLVNFVGNHDEPNPIDAFGVHFPAAAATALLHGPILTYNGFELGCGQAAMLGKLESTDLGKAIPFDVPVQIDWESTDPARAAFVRRLFTLRKRYKTLFVQGAIEVLSDSESPIVAWTAGMNGHDEGPEAILVAANFGSRRAHRTLFFSRPVLADFGAFSPDPEQHYALEEVLSAPDEICYICLHGQRLLERGLVLDLAPGEAMIFEIRTASPPT